MGARRADGVRVVTGYLWHGKPDLERINAEVMAARASVGRSDIGQRIASRPVHGTDARYKQHRREGEEPCAACRVAASRERKRREENRRKNARALRA